MQRTKTNRVLADDKDVFWGNNANELNASYAADGYARVNGIGVSTITLTNIYASTCCSCRAMR